MPYTNYENIIIPAEAEKFTAPASSHNIEETADSLVTKSLAEANAEEILDIVLNNTFDCVCPLIPSYIQQYDKYDKPLIATPSLTNIFSVLEMESNLPAPSMAKINYHSDYANESGDESQEEPVFTSPIYVKSGPENINILEENTKRTAESCNVSEYSPDPSQQPLDCEGTANEKLGINENIAKCEVSDQISCAKSESRIHFNNQTKSQIGEKEETEYLSNFGDANDTTKTIDKTELKVGTSEQKLSLVGKIIGDVVPDFSRYDDVEMDLQPQVVQAYVLYPGSSANAENTTATNNNDTPTTEIEGEAFNLDNLNKDDNKPSSSNEASVETPLVVNEVGNLLDYFEHVNNSVDSQVQIVDNPSDELIVNCGTLCEEVKRVAKEVAAKVFEGQGDGTSIELSNLSIQLAHRLEQSTTEIQAQIPEQPSSPDKSQGPQMVSEQIPCASTSKSDEEEIIAVHKTSSVDSDLQDFLSDMHLQDEMNEREVQVISRDDDSESMCEAAIDSNASQFGNYLPSSGLGTEEDLEDNFSYRSGSEINLSLKKSFLDTSRLPKVVDEPYSLEKMARNMEDKNPNIKANLKLGKVGDSLQALCRMSKEEQSQDISDKTRDEENIEVWPTFEEKPTLEEKLSSEEKPTLEGESSQEEKSRLEGNTTQKRRRWHRVRNLLSCFRNERQSSDDA